MNKKGVSILEYILLFIIIMSAFYIMMNYIQRGIHGNWAKSGQSFGFGRQYDPQKSIECSFDDVSNLWYDRNCFEYHKNADGCNGNIATTYCDDGSTCGTVNADTCADGTTCGQTSCEQNIIEKECSTVDICQSSNSFMNQ